VAGERAFEIDCFLNQSAKVEAHDGLLVRQPDGLHLALVATDAIPVQTARAWRALVALKF
jgi:hypothetical protein